MTLIGGIIVGIMGIFVLTLGTILKEKIDQRFYPSYTKFGKPTKEKPKTSRFTHDRGTEEEP